MVREQSTPALADTVYGGQQWLLDYVTLVSPVDYATYFEVIGTSADADALTIISWTIINH